MTLKIHVCSCFMSVYKQRPEGNWKLFLSSSIPFYLSPGDKASHWICSSLARGVSNKLEWFSCLFLLLGLQSHGWLHPAFYLITGLERVNGKYRFGEKILKFHQNLLIHIYQSHKSRCILSYKRDFLAILCSSREKVLLEINERK